MQTISKALSSHIPQGLPSPEVKDSHKQDIMELDFLRRRIFNTTFTTSDASGFSKPIYRISTTRSWTLFPVKTTIEFVGAEGAEKHRVVAEIIWNWPSQDRSYVHFGGHLYTLNQFLGRGPGFMNSDSFITFDNETYTWRTHAFEPQLYDSHGQQIVSYKREPCGLRKPNSITPSGHLSISEGIASNQSALDAVFTSFFIFKTTRDISLPWKKQQGVQLSGTAATYPVSDDRGDYVRLLSVA